MDKETLSNYGWIVICVLVLSVMIALATPFGSYISSAVKSTTAGLFETNRSALNSTGLINVGDQSFDDGNHTNGVYTVAATGITLTDENDFPIPSANDTYEEGDYIYTYNVGGNYGTEWSVVVKDTSKTSYGEILSEIAGKPITSMSGTFNGCTSLATAPVIPNSVTYMGGTFYGCTSLTTAPIIPNSVISVSQAFRNCTSLTTAPTIPNGVTHMGGTFSGCTSLTTAPTIPNSVTNIAHTFNGCTSLAGTIEINVYSLKYGNECFYNTEKPIILIGSSESRLLNYLAKTANNGNVTVQ